jgi:hypothetical protein
VPINWSGKLRDELRRRADVYARQSGAPSYLSLGTPPTRLFEPYDDGVRHGNFVDASYQAIGGEPSWKARTQKAHSQRNALPTAKRSTGRELDSSNSSDALLMNCFCYPRAAKQILKKLLPRMGCTAPQFGVRAKVAMVDGGPDSSEIDMQIDSTIFEAKLTEYDFTSGPKSHVKRYSRFTEVFEIAALPQTSDEFHGYQLIRNVLAADQHGWAFYLICDARRPDLLHEWWSVHSAIRVSNLRERCGFLLWQEMVCGCPEPLAAFLKQKYGLGGVAN